MDSPFPFTPEMMEKIEAEMRKICKEKLKPERFELPREEAIRFMEERNEPYKVELIHDLPDGVPISFYRQGEFTDLCAGPHLDSTGRIKGNAIKGSPMRCAELGIVHRHELSGALHGMFRVRCFTQDDAHILLAKEQITDEVVRIVKLFDEVYSVFGLPYTIELSTIGEKYCPVMIHRVVFGSIGRSIGVITEHFAGAFPVWLSPVQAVAMPITDRVNDYAEEVKAKLNDLGFRVESDLRNEKIGYKIREAQLQKTPYMLIIGDKEKEAGSVSVRTRSGVDLGAMLPDEFVEKLRQKVDFME